ncbi:MAG: iron chelate uptake ABC transporter family permease subunit, partial [Candidatus Methanomethylophilaceae archaeon]|nr:iron chelate uptake ABC transporter family permease subunit [Candidatus Methanomethylophilaceae archaeon]
MSAMRGLFRSRAVPDEDIGAIAQDASIYARWDGGETEQDAHIEQEYRGYIARKIAFMIVFAVLSFIAGGLVITYGDYPLDFFEVYGIIWDHILHGPPEDPIEFLKDHVVWSLRLPRVLVALIAGFGFAVAGAVMQSTLKNPMADSYT